MHSILKHHKYDNLRAMHFLFIRSKFLQNVMVRAFQSCFLPYIIHVLFVLFSGYIEAWSYVKTDK